MSQRGFLLAVVLFLVPIFTASSVVAANEDVRMVRVQGNVLFDGKNYPTGDYDMLVNGKVLNIDGVVWLKRGETSFARFAAQKVSVSRAGEIKFVTSDRDLDILNRARTAANIESQDSLISFRGPLATDTKDGDGGGPFAETVLRDPGGSPGVGYDPGVDPPDYDPPRPPQGMALMIMPMDGGGPIAIRGDGTSATLGERTDRGTSITTSSTTPGSPDAGTTTTSSSGGGNAPGIGPNTP